MKDLTGRTFGWLTVQKVDRPDLYKDGHKRAGQIKRWMWLCKCVCGNMVSVQADNLVCRERQGVTQSCGCYRKQNCGDMFRTHGATDTDEHNVWKGMRKRCYQKTDKVYANYGGRGIRMCKRWKDSFENFLADMGKRPSGEHQIERRDNNKHYEPSNCYWATRQQQARNKRNNRMITHNGETMCLIDWAERTGFSAITIHMRLKRGWSIEDALTKPIRGAT